MYALKTNEPESLYKVVYDCVSYSRTSQMIIYAGLISI